MSSKKVLILLIISMGLTEVSCQVPHGGVRTARKSLDKEQLWLPPEAWIPFSKLAPALQRPVDSPDASKLPERASSIVSDARKHIAARQYAQAIKLLERAAGFAPNSPIIHRELGLAYAALGDSAKAKMHLEKSVRKAPDHIWVQMLLAGYELKDGKVDNAIIRFRKALLCSNATDANPFTAKVLYYLASLLEGEGYYRAALDCCNRLTRILKKHEKVFLNKPELRRLILRPERLMLMRGRMLLKLGQFPQAAELLERAYRLDKSNPDTGLLAVEALIKINKLNQAKDIVMEMLIESPSRSNAICAAMKWCIATGDASSTVKILQEYSSSTGDKPADALIVAMARASIELGARQKASEIISRYIKEIPEDTSVVLALAELEAQAGRFSQAARYFAAMLSSPRFDVDKVRSGIVKMIRRGVTKDFADKFATSARLQKSPDAKAAQLCVSAIIYDTLDLTERAENLLQEIINERPKFLPAYEVLEWIYVRRGEFDKLDKLFQQIDRVAKDTCFRFYIVGKSQFERGKIEDAIGNLQQARQRNGCHIPSLLILGKAYMRKNDFLNAEKYLQLAFVMSPKDERIASALLEVYLYPHYKHNEEKRRLRQAEQMLQRFMQSSCESLAARLLYYRFCLASSRIYQARYLLQQLRRQAPDDVDVQLAELDLLLPHPIGNVRIPRKILFPAIEKIKKVLCVDPRNIQANLLYAEILMNQGQFNDAANLLRNLWQRRPYDMKIVSLYFDSLVKAKRVKELLSAVERFSRRGPLAIEFRMIILDSLINAKCFDRAEALVEQWLSTPTSKRALIALRLEALKVYESSGHYEKAKGLLDRWILSLQGAGYDSDVAKRLISSLQKEKLRILGKAGQFAEAIEYAKQLREKSPKDYQIEDILIAILAEAKQYARAEKLIDEWITSASAERRNILQVAKIMLLAKQKHFDQLIKFGENCIRNNPKFVGEYYLAMITALTEQKRYDDALKLAKQWVKRYENTELDEKKIKALFSATFSVVDVLIEAGKDNEALIQAKRLANRYPERIEPLTLLKYVYSRMGKLDKVVEISRKIYKLTPDDPGINNDLGYTWADKGVNLDKAESMILKALSARPNNVAILDSYGWVLYKKGQFAKAKRIFDRILRSNDFQELPPIILDHAGDTYWRLGLKIPAVQLWTMAVESARKQKDEPREDEQMIKMVLSATPAKIAAAVRAGRPKVAPLGKGVSILSYQR